MKKGELLIQEGKRANEIGLIITGMLRKFYTKDGEEKQLTSFLKVI